MILEGWLKGKVEERRCIRKRGCSSVGPWGFEDGWGFTEVVEDIVVQDGRGGLCWGDSCE